MPRNRQNADKYSREDFRKEILVGMASIGLRYDQELAEISGIPNSTISGKLKEPEKFTVLQLRKVIKAVPLDPGAVLRLLGYDTKQIRLWIENQGR